MEWAIDDDAHLEPQKKLRLADTLTIPTDLSRSRLEVAQLHHCRQESRYLFV
jgi:hypothetical protein